MKAESSKKSSKKVIQIFLVDDHPLIRSGLAQIISEEEDMNICGQASNAAEAFKKIPETGPDLVIVDLSLEGSNGIELIKNLKALYPHLEFMMFSMHDERVYAQRALRAGARAFVMKHEDKSTIKLAVRRSMSGNIYVSDRVSEQLLHQIVSGNTSEKSSPVDRLTDRELEVIQLIGKGYSTREVASSLNVSVKTIESHRAHIKEKLDLASGNELVKFAIQWVEHENGMTH